MSPPPRLREHVPLAPLTTFEVGGPARFLLEARSEDEAMGALEWAHREGLPVTVLGGGSNLLVADRGIEGLVLRVAFTGVEIAEASSEGRVRLRVGAGERLDDVVARSVDEGLAGLECLSGIPGLIGATPIQNVGAYGQEVAETIATVEVLDRRSFERRTLRPEDCEFGYRSSAFKGGFRHRYLVLAVSFDLRADGKPSLRYQELGRWLASRGIEEPSLRDVREAVLTLRRAKSMVIDPEDPNRRSAGSFFVNPVVSKEQADEIAERAGSEGMTMPRFAAPPFVKLSAAWLIERAGFPRGSTEGRVGLSSRHALALVNRGGASASELVGFASRIRETVREKFGVILSPEPELMGFDRSAIAHLVA